MRCAVGVALECDRRNGDDWSCRKPLFQVVVLRFALGKREPPPIVVNHDAYMIRIVEGSRTPIERFIIEVPFRRSEPPNEPGEIMPVLVVSGASPLGGEVVLIPPLQLGFRRQRYLPRLLIADEIAAHRD